ncbi:protein-ADP-ribose hydrolase [Histomonas meleagridis]|uniref:protein-ADP-ribose hydrolase n=1 Tax=Histomonas meleagridis TaxID=135588 RepID=UPI00355A72A9|nr:protein-ADP-ribose hydrolase [Histomonas meleagridis]KAH0797895.1 protein-ADP-ribose hydrolase [Histomonas meleagridis]
MQFLKPFLNMREPSPLSEKLYSLIDHFLSHLSHQKEIVDANLIPNVKQSYPKTHINNSEIITLWRGDITCLKIDAIVNAANSQLLGCFQPSHLCIDNVIHTYAGPRLRDDCYKIMTAQGFEEPTGNAKITRAYNLPSKFVIHTVGPIYENSRKNKCKKMLESCYIRSLEVASSVEGVKSIAFCCISTGIFGYPQKDAAEVAIDTVDKWLTNNPGKFEKVVFNVFTEKDFLIYKSILSGN